MKTKKLIIAAAIVLSAASIFAYIPEDNAENSFQARIVDPFNQATALVEDGVKAIRQEVVKSEYSNERTSELTKSGLKETEKGGEEVTSKEVLYFEPKEEVYEAGEIMKEIDQWIEVYKTVNAADVQTFKKIKGFIKKKEALIDSLIEALKYQKDNKDTVLEIKRKIVKNDKDFKTHMKLMKGKIVLIKNKPLPELKE